MELRIFANLTLFFLSRLCFCLSMSLGPSVSFSVSLSKFLSVHNLSSFPYVSVSLHIPDISVCLCVSLCVRTSPCVSVPFCFSLLATGLHADDRVVRDWVYHSPIRGEELSNVFSVASSPLMTMPMTWAPCAVSAAGDLFIAF